MNNFANTISYIFKLIKETPKTLNIIAGNVLSGFFSFYWFANVVACFKFNGR